MFLKLLFIINILLLFSGNELMAQTSDTASINSLPVMDPVNRKTNKGKKTGVWKENNGLVEAHYTQGQLDGPYTEYNKKNHTLKCVGNYTKGKLTGSWKYYDKKGVLSVSVDSIMENDTVNIADGHMGQLRPPYKGYLKDYYKDGKVRNEGPALFEDPVVHYYKIAIWHFYDKNGLMVKQELYKNLNRFKEPNGRQ